MSKVIENIKYGEHKDQVGDLHLPEGGVGRKLVLMIHGGAWISMDRVRMYTFSDFMADNGYAVYNIDYRLHPESPYPACEEDCIAASEYLLSGEMVELGGAKYDKVYLIGASAGAHLAMVAGLKLPLEKVAGIINISGPSELTAPEVDDLVVGTAKLYSEFEQAEQRRLLDLVSPTKLCQDRELPPLLVIHNNVDTVVDHYQAARITDAWLANKGELQVFSYAGDDTKFHDIWCEECPKPRLYPKLEAQILTFMEIF